MRLFLKYEHEDIKSRIVLLYENATPGIAITLISFSVLVFGIASKNTTDTPHFLPYIMWLGIFVLSIVRYLDIKRTITRFYYLKQEGYTAAMRRLSLGLLLNCNIWMFFSFCFMPQMTLVQLCLCAIVLSALAGGATSVLGPSRLLSTMYISVLLLPYSIMGFFLDIEGFYFISILGLSFWVIMLIAAKKSSEFVTKTMRLQVANKELVKQLEREKAGLGYANSKLDEYSMHLESEVERRTLEIVKISNIDPLTGLLNRKALLLELEQTLNNLKLTNHKLAIFFIDLNGFKEINDGFGHSYGDKVLSVIAARLSKSIDTNHLSTLDKDFIPAIVSRWGGDEFIIACQYDSPDHIHKIGNNINFLIEQEITIGISRFNLNASIGIAIYPENSHNCEELIQHADLAMYHAKNIKDKTPTMFCESLKEKYSRILHLKNGLAEAIDKSQLALVFQPIVDIVENRVFAYEVLLRWKFENKNIQPTEFIELAEKTKQIIPIGYWVIENAIAQFCQIKNYQELHLSINLSRAQIVEPDFIHKAKNIIKRYPIVPQNIHFELTETFAVEDKAVFNKVVQALSDAGFKISLDDFGTGYSSLEQLHALCFNAVKIDRTFVIELNRKDQAILTAAQFIANNCDAITIVEGIEEKAQLVILKELGFKYIQGYYFSKPMPLEAIDTWQRSFLKHKEASTHVQLL